MQALKAGLLIARKLWNCDFPCNEGLLGRGPSRLSAATAEGF
jgi:hypothetical protein